MFSVRICVAGSPTTTLNPRPRARVLITSIVCGYVFSSTKYVVASPRIILLDIAIASAAAVASSKRDAFAIPIPVRSMIIC